MSVYQDGIEHSPSEATALAGFPTRLPAELPTGTNPKDVTVMVSRIFDSGDPLVTVTYWRVQKRPNGESRTAVLILSEKPFRGALWFDQGERVPTNPQGEKATCEEEPVNIRPDVQGRLVTCSFGGSVLAWVDGGIEHSLMLDFGLTREQALAVAKSIK